MAAEARPLVLSIVGTRPEAIKLLPVVRALAAHGRMAQQVVLTGQHGGLGDAFAALPGIVPHELAIDPREQSPGEICERIHDALCGHLVRTRPALLLVQGDTTSALAGALAARDCAIPLGHVEAGLRSFDADDPWPEERNRVAIDRLSHLLFAPTRSAAANLAAERLPGRIYVTGNSGIDAAFHARAAQPRPARRGGRKLILVTCHRRENRETKLADIAAALRRLTAALPVEIAFPLHTNPHVGAAVEALLRDVPYVRLLPPLDHAGMVALIGRCWLILTDSGGLQEEGPALGRPVLVLRDVTERVDARASSQIVGTDPGRIFAAVEKLLADDALYRRMAKPSLAYGDGRASVRIAAHIARFLDSAKLPQAPATVGAVREAAPRIPAPIS